MRRLATLLLLGICLTTSAQMWRELATTDWRIDTLKVHTLGVEIDNLNFFRDNEFKSRLAHGYTLPGLWIQPKLTYTPHRRIRLEAGLHALIFNGANKYPNYVYHDIATWKGNQYQSGAHVLPWFRAQMEFKHCAFVLGNIYGGENHGLVEPLWNTETNLSQDPEMGVQFLWQLPCLRADVWLNWQSYIFEEDTHQEAFTLGTTWRFLLNSEGRRTHWYVPVQAVLQHRGGEQDVTNLGAQTLCNFNVGIGLNQRVDSSVLTRCKGEINVMCAAQEKGTLWPFQTGLALHAAADAMLWDALHVRLGHVAVPRHFVSLYGSPLFTSISRLDDGYSHRGLQTTYARVDYSYTIARHYTLGAEVEAFQSWLGDCPAGKSNEFNFSFGIYLRANPSFIIKRFKS